MVDRTRRPGSSRDAAEAAFKAVTTRPVTLASPSDKLRSPAVPHAKETVSIRIDRDVLEHFQENGPGWQDRLNAALRKAAGLA